MPLAVLHDDRSGDCARYAAGLVLVRPDGFVAWADESMDGFEEALRTAVALG